MPFFFRTQADYVEVKQERDALQQEISEAREEITQLRADIQALDDQQQEDAEVAEGQFKDLEKALKEQHKVRSGQHVCSSFFFFLFSVSLALMWLFHRPLYLAFSLLASHQLCNMERWGLPLFFSLMAFFAHGIWSATL